MECQEGMVMVVMVMVMVVMMVMMMVVVTSSRPQKRECIHALESSTEMMTQKIMRTGITISKDE